MHFTFFFFFFFYTITRILWFLSSKFYCPFPNFNKSVFFFQDTLTFSRCQVIQSVIMLIVARQQSVIMEMKFMKKSRAFYFEIFFCSMERKKEQARRERENQARLFKEEQRRNDIVTNVGLFSEPVKTVFLHWATSYLFNTLFQVERGGWIDIIM